ncbi:MAG TPA: hypothetical protein VK459_07865 [Polyangiaceae bacterium]|nr:hypothetical protein [Polyangiaceae bacterium]
MNQQEFEHQVLELWTRTRVPLTRSNLLAHTRIPRDKLDRWLNEMVRERLLELDSDDDGEIVWKVRGSARPSRGPDTLADINRKSKLSEDVDRLTSGASIAIRAAGITKSSASAPPGREKKSLIAAGALSFFFGPLGWLYAAPLKEAIPAILVFGLICAILPNFLLAYILPMVNIPSAIAGLLYAWSYNREGRRMPLVLKDPPVLPK